MASHMARMGQGGRGWSGSPACGRVKTVKTEHTSDSTAHKTSWTLPRCRQPAVALVVGLNAMHGSKQTMRMSAPRSATGLPAALACEVCILVRHRAHCRSVERHHEEQRHQRGASPRQQGVLAKPQLRRSCRLALRCGGQVEQRRKGGTHRGLACWGAASRGRGSARHHLQGGGGGDSSRGQGSGRNMNNSVWGPWRGGAPRVGLAHQPITPIRGSSVL